MSLQTLGQEIMTIYSVPNPGGVPVEQVYPRGTTDILDWITLCCGVWSWALQVNGSIPGLYQMPAAPSQLWKHVQISPGEGGEAKSPPAENSALEGENLPLGSPCSTTDPKLQLLLARGLTWSLSTLLHPHYTPNPSQKELLAFVPKHNIIPQLEALARTGPYPEYLSSPAFTPTNRRRLCHAAFQNKGCLTLGVGTGKLSKLQASRVRTPTASNPSAEKSDVQLVFTVYGTEETVFFPQNLSWQCYQASWNMWCSNKSEKITFDSLLLFKPHEYFKPLIC